MSNSRFSVEQIVDAIKPTETGIDPFLLRPDNGLVFTSSSYTALARIYGLQRKFITPHSPEQNGMVKRVITTRKDQCVHRH